MNASDLQLFGFLNGLAGVSYFLSLAIIAAAEYLPYLMAVLPLLVFWRRENRNQLMIWKTSTAYLVALVVRFGVVSLIRLFTYTPRPFLASPSVIQLIPESGSSFPSGHASFFFALAASVWFYNRKLGYFIGALALINGAARVAAGVHWPSDILGGAVLGVLVSFIVHCLWRRR